MVAILSRGNRYLKLWNTTTWEPVGSGDIEYDEVNNKATFSTDNNWIAIVSKSVTNFIWTITPGILDQFQQSKWLPKALKKTFQMVPKMSQEDQYSPSYQQISQ